MVNGQGKRPFLLHPSLLTLINLLTPRFPLPLPLLTVVGIYIFTQISKEGDRGRMRDRSRTYQVPSLPFPFLLGSPHIFHLAAHTRSAK